MFRFIPRFILPIVAGAVTVVPGALAAGRPASVGIPNTPFAEQAKSIVSRDDHLAVIVLTNANHANPGRISQYIAGTYLPALMPKMPKAIEDKEPKVTELLRDISAQIREAKLKPELFKPQLWAILSLALKDLQEQSRGDGDLQKLELLARTQEKDERTYRYRMILTNHTYLVTLTIEKDGKVSGLWAEEE